MNKLTRHPWVLAGRTYFKMVCLPQVSRVRGYRELPQGDLTEDGIRSDQTAASVEVSFLALELSNRGDAIPARSIRHPDAYVYRVPASDCVRIMNCGAVELTGKRFINCGVHSSAAMLELIQQSKPRNHVREESLIVLPWSHPWLSFGDFMTHVLPFLCRILSTLTDAEKKRAVVGLCGAWRREYAYSFLECLGLEREQFVDLEQTRLVPETGGEVCIANSGDLNAYTTHPSDYLTVRTDFLKDIVPDKQYERIYVARSGQRQLLQEAELKDVLASNGITMLEDVPRSASEQVAIFNSAKLVVGPHGAAFGNLVFSDQATLFEFQHPGWVQPSFRYICQYVGNTYHVMVSEQGALRQAPTQGYQQRDIDIPVDCILKQLDELGGNF